MSKQPSPMTAERPAEIREAITGAHQRARVAWHVNPPTTVYPYGDVEELLAHIDHLTARLAEIQAGAEADAVDLETMRDGTKLTRAGLVMCIVYAQQDIKELKAEVSRQAAEREEALAKMAGDLAGQSEFPVLDDNRMLVAQMVQLRAEREDYKAQALRLCDKLRERDGQLAEAVAQSRTLAAENERLRAAMATVVQHLKEAKDADYSESELHYWQHIDAALETASHLEND